MLGMFVDVFGNILCRRQCDLPGKDLGQRPSVEGKSSQQAVLISVQAMSRGELCYLIVGQGPREDADVINQSIELPKPGFVTTWLSAGQGNGVLEEGRGNSQLGRLKSLQKRPVQVRTNRVPLSYYRELLPNVAVACRIILFLFKAFNFINDSSITSLNKEHGMPQHILCALSTSIIANAERVGTAAVFCQQRAGCGIRMLRHEPNHKRMVLVEEFSEGKIQVGVTAETEGQRSYRHNAIVVFLLFAPLSDPYFLSIPRSLP